MILKHRQKTAKIAKNDSKMSLIKLRQRRRKAQMQGLHTDKYIAFSGVRKLKGFEIHTGHRVKRILVKST